MRITLKELKLLIKEMVLIEDVRKKECPYCVPLGSGQDEHKMCDVCQGAAWLQQDKNDDWVPCEPPCETNTTSRIVK